MAGNSGTTSTENINEVILRLLRLKPGDELDYQTYAEIIKKKLTSARMVGKGLPAEEDKLLREEFKRVRNKKGRFKLKTKKARVSSPPPPPPSPSRSGGGGGGNNPPNKGRIVKSSSGKVTADKYFYQYYVQPVNVKDVTKKTAKVSKTTDPLTRISSLLDSILNTLTEINKFERNNANRQRKDVENRRRRQRETDLESKPIEGIKKALSAIVKPFQSIWDKIVNFITNIILGRIVIKLIDWIANPKNQSKIQSIIRFFGDHWPTLLALYLRFGTGLGRFVAKLGGVLIKGAFKLGVLAAKLALKAGIGKAGGRLSKVAGFLGGKKGKLLASGLGVATDVAVTAGTAGVIGNLSGKGESTQKFAGGGAVRYPKFAGGGFANFGKIFGGAMGGASLGSMFGPMGMLLGAGIGGAKESGFVSGQKGVDKVPAMLSDGEFVMSVGAVNKYGVETLEAMNAAGGGTNQPKIVGGKTYAAGGGRIEKDYGANTPFLKDPINAISRFIKYKFGVDVNKKTTWGDPSVSSSKKMSTGSLLTDPVGAISRITSSMGILNTASKSLNNSQRKKTSGQKNMFQEIAETLQGSGASTYRDAGSIYAKQMLGGLGGPISEMDLGKESKQELQKAIQRAKKRTGFQIKRVESEIAKLKAMGAKDGNPALERQKSFLSKLKSGGIRVEYADYADEKGNMSESTKNAKKILGQFWAYGRNKKEGGGYRIEDKYDFDTFKKKVKDPKTGKMVEKDLDQGELIRDVILGKGKDTQQRLQAAYLLNPFKGKGDVDMVLGGKRTDAENFGLAISKTSLGSMLGISGNPKDKNLQKLEANRPWWDKMGWFGGTSAQRMRDSEKFRSSGMGGRYVPGSQQTTIKSAQVSKSNKPKTPVKPLPKPKPKIQVSGGGMGGRRGSGSNPSSGSKAPSFSAKHGKGNIVSASAYGIMR
jgi:hypothetical protein